MLGSSLADRQHLLDELQPPAPAARQRRRRG
jgi:hypothetical protein